MAKPKSKKQTPKHKKELKRVRAFISRAEKRGYRFSDDFKKSLYGLHTNKLKSLKPEKLYKLAEAISDITGKVVSGLEKRKEERQISARKGAETRKYNKWLKSDEGKAYLSEQQNKNIKPPASMPYVGDIVYQNVTELIDTYPTAGANALQKALEKEISRYGLDRVTAALSQAPKQFVELAQVIAFYEKGSQAVHRAIRSFFDLIRGTVPTMEEAREMGELLDELTDFDAV